jgi:hypothetical protein
MKNVPSKRDAILKRWRNLFLVLIEIKGGVELRLAEEQFFHPSFVIERLVGLGLILGEGSDDPKGIAQIGSTHKIIQVRHPTAHSAKTDNYPSSGRSPCPYARQGAKQRFR